jgi:hypothetical protein
MGGVGCLMFFIFFLQERMEEKEERGRGREGVDCQVITKKL